ncbi:MAG: LysR substrate-binding domain-containing protein [Albidovulum sp.]
MPRNLPPLNALRAFEAAGRHESFSRAAEELGVSHSAISRHVRGLEMRLSTKLFKDLPRGLRLTPAGAQYLAQISPAFDQIAEATEAFWEKPSGAIVISCEPMFAIKWLMPRLAGFYAQYPEVEVRLEVSQVLVDIARYEADFAIRFFNSGVPDLPATLLSDVEIYPYAAPDLGLGPDTSPAELLRFPLLRDRREDLWPRWLAAAGSDPAKSPVGAWHMAEALALEAAVAGHGVYLGAADIVDADLHAGRLMRCSSVGIRQGRFYLVFGEGVIRRKAVRQFRDWLLAESEGLRGSDQQS